MSSKVNARAPLPRYHGNDAEWKRAFQNWLREANQGHLANSGTLTLTANSFFTTLVDDRISVQSFVEFMPTTPNAGEERAAGTMYVSGMTNGSLTLTHASAASTDRTFLYTIWG